MVVMTHAEDCAHCLRQAGNQASLTIRAQETTCSSTTVMLTLIHFDTPLFRQLQF